MHPHPHRLHFYFRVVSNTETHGHIPPCAPHNARATSHERRVQSLHATDPCIFHDHRIVHRGTFMQHPQPILVKGPIRASRTTAPSPITTGPRTILRSTSAPSPIRTRPTMELSTTEPRTSVSPIRQARLDSPQGDRPFSPYRATMSPIWQFAPETPDPRGSEWRR